MLLMEVPSIPKKFSLEDPINHTSEWFDDSSQCLITPLLFELTLTVVLQTCTEALTNTPWVSYKAIVLMRGIHTAVLLSYSLSMDQIRARVVNC